jgi:hypothetical protein
MKLLLSLGLAATLLVGLWPAPAYGALTAESLKTYIQRVGARIDSSKGNLFVTSSASGRNRVEIRLLNDTARHRLGFYAYGFGNAGSAKDQGALYEYLLNANSELGIGSFFVDKEKDIGYKFLADTRDPLSYATFELIYLAMVTVINEQRPAIARMMSREAPADKPADAPPPEGPDESTAPPPVRRVAATAAARRTAR